MLTQLCYWVDRSNLEATLQVAPNKGSWLGEPSPKVGPGKTTAQLSAFRNALSAFAATA
jgi:hypothetical protein